MADVVRSFREAGGTRRFVLLGIVAVAVVAVAWVGRWASQPTYVTLYHDLDLKEAGAVADKLGKSDIPHRLGGGGTEIEVPVTEAARARVALAKEGLPTSGRPGLELFDRPSWGMTDFTQRVTYQRALEGELARTIGGLRGVQAAAVHLVLPSPGSIRRPEKPAGASVVLTLGAGGALPSDAIQGIAYIVSNSVEGLSPDNVAIVDDAGRVLSTPAAAGGMRGASTRQLEIQRNYEQHLSHKIQDLLATVVGAGRARAEVSAELNFDQIDSTVESFDPDGAVIENEQRSEVGAAGSTNSQSSVTNAYQNSRRVQKNVGSVGKLTRLTVAVLVDQKAMPASGAGRVELDRLESMVRNAIGIDSTRGDRVTVMAVPFEADAAAAAVAAAGGAPKTDLIVVAERFSRPAIGLVSVIAVIVILLQAVQIAGRAGPAPAAAPSAAAPPPLATNGAPAATVIGQVPPSLAERPETTAQVLRAWMAETS